MGLALGAWAAGSRAPPPQPCRPPPSWPYRTAALAPALWALGAHPALDAAVWGVSLGGALWYGWRETAARRSCPAVDLPDPWRPSRRNTCRSGLLLRVTGWPGQAADSWSAPAVVVAVGRQRRGEFPLAPRPGEGILLRGQGEAPPLGALLAAGVESGPGGSPAQPGGFDMARFLAGRGLVWDGRVRETCFVAGASGRRAGGAGEEGGAPPASPRPIPAEVGAGGRWTPAAAAALAPVRTWLLERLARDWPPREAALLAGVLLGERDASSRRNQEPFARVGLAHLFAVSGLNVGIVLGLMLFLAAPARPGPNARLLLALAALPPYTLLTGATGSIVRASSFVLLTLAAPVLGRRGDSLRAVGLLFWLSVLFLPGSLLDAGSRLSYLAAAGLIVAMRLGRSWRQCPHAAARWFALGCAATLGSTWFTLPDTAASFGWLNLLSPLANLAAVPLFSAIVWVATLALLAAPLCGWVAQALAADAWLLARALEIGTALIDRAPARLGIPALGPGRAAALLGLSLALGLALAGRGPLPPRGRRAAAVLLSLALLAVLPLGRAAPAGRMTAVQFAVEQGDCAALVFPDRSVVLIDTGPALGAGLAVTRSAVPWLEREGVRRLAGVVLTHAHDDHTAGASEVARRYRVDRWWLGGRTAAPPGLPAAARVERPVAGDVLHEAGGWSLVCVHPPADAPEAGENENDRSLAVVLRRGAAPAALWTGDLERSGEGRLLAAGALPPGLRLQFWKAGHHGSRTSGGPELLAGARPALIVASCGVANRHRHPSHGPFTVGADTVPLLRTDRDGSVHLAWERDGTLAWRCGRGRHGRVPLPAGPP